MSKVAGNTEINQMFQTCGLSIDDIMEPQRFGFPLKPERLPRMFLYLDEEVTFEKGLDLLYGSNML